MENLEGLKNQVESPMHLLWELDIFLCILLAFHYVLITSHIALWWAPEIYT